MTVRNDKIYYSGLFLDFDYMWEKIRHITDGRYDRVIKRPHITIQFRPENQDYSLVGTKAEVIVTGYGYDDENEGLFVKIETDNEELKALCQSVEVPHITLTVTVDGHSVNTRYVDFYPVPIVRLTATYGVVTEDGELVTE
ncbi:MAG: hypothetical protein IJZ51_09265 [Ruminiclostridium sp.]|nr:hypothetical protein [Ruminiclostridium sp.]